MRLELHRGVCGTERHDKVLIKTIAGLKRCVILMARHHAHSMVCLSDVEFREYNSPNKSILELQDQQKVRQIVTRLRFQ